MKWDTDSFISFFILFKLIYVFLKDSSNEHFVRNYVILWENRDLQLKIKTDSQFVQNRGALVCMLFISLLYKIHKKYV